MVATPGGPLVRTRPSSKMTKYVECWGADKPFANITDSKMAKNIGLAVSVREGHCSDQTTDNAMLCLFASTEHSDDRIKPPARGWLLWGMQMLGPPEGAAAGHDVVQEYGTGDHVPRSTGADLSV